MGQSLDASTFTIGTMLTTRERNRDKGRELGVQCTQIAIHVDGMEMDYKCTEKVEGL